MTKVRARVKAMMKAKVKEKEAARNLKLKWKKKRKMSLLRVKRRRKSKKKSQPSALSSTCRAVAVIGRAIHATFLLLVLITMEKSSRTPMSCKLLTHSSYQRELTRL